MAFLFHQFDLPLKFTVVAISFALLLTSTAQGSIAVDVLDQGTVGFNGDWTLGYEFTANVNMDCLLYTSPSPRDLSTSRMPSSA